MKCKKPKPLEGEEKQPTFIRTSQHSIKEANIGKKDKLIEFINSYNKVIRYFIEYLWNNEVVWLTKDKTHILNIKEDKLDCPSMLTTKGVSIDGLSQRVIKCAATQACGIIKGTIEKRKKRLYVRDKLKDEGKDYRKLQEILDKQNMTMPILEHNIGAELNSICFDIETDGVFFDEFIRLMCLGEAFDSIKIPIKHHRQSKKWSSKGKRLNSILITANDVYLRYEIPKPPLKQEGKKVGADQGKVTCLSLSDRQVTLPNQHNHDLNSICHKMSRQQKGSKAFERSKQHRKNYINYSLNNIDLSDIAQINIEDVYNLPKQNREMSHFTLPLIDRKVMTIAEEHGVRVNFQSSPFRSQRCSECGWVCKKNRKRKVFCCTQCQHQDDADINAATNHEQDLPDASFLRQTKIKEFYWKTDGFFTSDGEVIAVPLAQKSPER